LASHATKPKHFGPSEELSIPFALAASFFIEASFLSAMISFPNLFVLLFATATAFVPNQLSLRVDTRRKYRCRWPINFTVFFSHNRLNSSSQWSLTCIVSSLAVAGYVPDGLSPEQYRKLKEKEKSAVQGKNLGAFGVQSFKSRSLVAFQTDLEKGKAGHLMPMLNAKELLKQKKIKAEDIPYMQRLGSWDGSDVGKKTKGNELDKKYSPNEKPSGTDWTGRNPKRGPMSQAKAPPAPKKKFGLW
jgi:hypothetical protein